MTNAPDKPRLFHFDEILAAQTEAVGFDEWYAENRELFAFREFLSKAAYTQGVKVGQATRVKVKDLEWSEIKYGEGRSKWVAIYYHDAGSVLADGYTIFYDNYGSDDDPNWGFGLNTKWGNRGTYPTLEAAKAAANDHHKAMVQSQMEETP